MSYHAPDPFRVHFASILRVFPEQIFTVIGYEVETETGDEENGHPFEDCR